MTAREEVRRHTCRLSHFLACAKDDGCFPFLSTKDIHRIYTAPWMLADWVQVHCPVCDCYYSKHKLILEMERKARETKRASVGHYEI